MFVVLVSAAFSWSHQMQKVKTPKRTHSRTRSETTMRPIGVDVQCRGVLVPARAMHAKACAKKRVRV